MCVSETELKGRGGKEQVCVASLGLDLTGFHWTMEQFVCCRFLFPNNNSTVMLLTQGLKGLMQTPLF